VGYRLSPAALQRCQHVFSSRRPDVRSEFVRHLRDESIVTANVHIESIIQSTLGCKRLASKSIDDVSHCFLTDRICRAYVSLEEYVSVLDTTDDTLHFIAVVWTAPKNHVSNCDAVLELFTGQCTLVGHA